jgi:hypothetical protein
MAFSTTSREACSAAARPVFLSIKKNLVFKKK